MDIGMVTQPWPSVVVGDHIDSESMEVSADQVTLRPLPVEVLLAGSLGVMMTVCLLGNVTVLFVFSRSHELREQISSVFIINLALTDICCATTVMPFCLVSVWFDRWIFGPVMCSVVCFLNYCFIITSMWTLAMISIDRYIYCIFPFRYQELMTHRRAVLFSLMAWALGVFFGSLPSAMQVVIYNHAEIICAVDWEADPVKVLTYTVSAFVICFITPMVVMILCYRGLYNVARRHASQIRLRDEGRFQGEEMPTAANASIENDANTTHYTGKVATNVGNQIVSRRRNMRAQERRTSRNSKAIRSICIMVAAYFICNTPFSLTKLLKCVYSNNDVVPFHLNAAASWVAFFNPCCNPIIYSIYREDFRTAIQRFVPSAWRKKVATQISPAAVPNEDNRADSIDRNAQRADDYASLTERNQPHHSVGAVGVMERSSDHPAIIVYPPVIPPPPKGVIDASDCHGTAAKIIH